MTAEQLIDALVEALCACTEELEGFRPYDRQALELADRTLKDYNAWCTQKDGK